MKDDNWDLIDGPEAHEIETINATSTLNTIETIVTYRLSKRKRDPSLTVIPDESELLDLHRASTFKLLEHPGAYRTCPVVVADEHQTVLHRPPEAADVQEFMEEFFKELTDIWLTGDALDVAAFALWRLNWVHPFKNGNGRTARAYSYTCLCTKLGGMLPGETTVIDQIMKTRPIYEQCLRDADGAPNRPTHRNLKSMKAYLDSLMQKQVASSKVVSRTMSTER